MIYTFFMKKFQKDKAPFPTTMVVQEYLYLYGQNDIVISFPGYMGTTSKSIGKFLRNMCFPANTYFTVGMNGKNQMKLKSNVQDYHNSFFNKIKNINKPLKDHSKMLFFLDPNSVNGGLLNQKEGDIELKDAQLLLKGCKVKAVLIGSSNQSYNTYFKDPADKGEADVFMIKDIALVKEDDKVSIQIPAPKILEVVPQNIPIDIVYEDKDILIVNKPQDMVVHPAPGNYEGTLVNAILYHCKDNLSSINGVIRPGIVHRIDKDTSGLLMIAKNNNAHNSLAEQLKEHSITREYQFICHGVVKEDKITVNKSIGRNPKDRLKMAVVKDGKNAVTHFEVIKRYENFTHMKAKLETGRTHQIRVHALSINHPLLGDEVYGPKNNKFKLIGQTLHAKKLGFIHPTTKEYIEFDSELPKYFQEILNKLK